MVLSCHDCDMSAIHIVVLEHFKKLFYFIRLISENHLSDQKIVSFYENIVEN
jgi:hypothetical protein